MEVSSILRLSGPALLTAVLSRAALDTFQALCTRAAERGGEGEERQRERKGRRKGKERGGRKRGKREKSEDGGKGRNGKKIRERERQGGVDFLRDCWEGLT